MPKYQVTVLFDASAHTEVLADSPEEASKKAQEMLDGCQRICHQCADELTTGDVIGAHVYDEDNAWFLLEDTQLGEMRGQVLEGANHLAKLVIVSRALGERYDKMKQLAAAMYAGPASEHNLPVRWLDALSAAANGEDFDVESLLPYRAEEAGGDK